MSLIRDLLEHRNHHEITFLYEGISETPLQFHDAEAAATPPQSLRVPRARDSI
jgi:hypothetical protein